ncbi:MAG: universal stress protein [Dehalococcoidia bacterium]|nr:universal stress protein [Dehalococcoidia bacterium]
MYQKALLPTDGSGVAAEAVAHAARVVGPDGTVLVVEVVDSVARILAQTTPAGFAYESMVGTSARLVEQAVEAQQREAERHMAEAAAALSAAGVKSVETLVLEGLPGDQLVKAAHEQGCDVVVMATHGRSGIRRFVLGSDADHVLRHLEGIPLLLVRPPHD